MEKSDKVRILSKLDEMINYIEELKGMLPEKDEYFQDLVKRRACEKTIELAIDSMTDVAAMIVSAQKLDLPTSEENIFDILIEYKILNKEMGEKLKDIKGFRNILIHRYGYVDNEIVYDNLNSYLNDFYEFKSLIELYINEQKINNEYNE